MKVNSLSPTVSPSQNGIYKLPSNINSRSANLPPGTPAMIVRRKVKYEVGAQEEVSQQE